MKKAGKVLLVVISVFLIVAYFVPVTREKEIFVGNTYENIISSVSRPRNWAKWDSSVRAAWQRDSSACHFNVDTSTHIITIDIPGEKVRVNPLNYLLYQVEETKDSYRSVFGFSIVPYIGNGQARSRHNAKIVYTQNISLLSHIFPFLRRKSFADETIAGLRAYLEDYTRFYGFPIEVKAATDTFFITKKIDILGQDLFKNLPGMFEDLNRFAQKNHCKSFNQNISFTNLSPDSISVLAGVNTDQWIAGDYLHNSVRLPSGQILAVAHFEGPFRNRIAVYKGMDRYLMEHELLKGAAPYEKYFSPMPVSDSSIVKMDILFPLRF